MPVTYQQHIVQLRKRNGNERDFIRIEYTSPKIPGYFLGYRKAFDMMEHEKLIKF